MSDNLNDRVESKVREIYENAQHHIPFADRANAGEATEKVEDDVTKVFDPIKDRIQRPESN